ncbi:hypothetical protein ACHQM5_001905 [Ranunculus cassubicifolius]
MQDSPCNSTTTTTHKVAVIGAGASGLVASRELTLAGHKVTVFERNSQIGGTWLYDPNTESDPLSTDPSRSIVHTSLYKSLRTNLAREAMGFRDYPFLISKKNGRDPRRYPGHKEVLSYLQDFASEFESSELIRFEREVIRVGLTGQGKLVVKSVGKGRDVAEAEEEFNAVVVCNGHYTKPNVAEIPGIDVWPGEQIHSHNYRVPDPFSKKVIVLIGNSHSSYDISREIATVAKEVHVASRSYNNNTPTKELGYNNLYLRSMVKGANKDGSVVFQDGDSIHVDVILHCTGYKFDFPFLDTRLSVNVDDNRVGPLYQHVFPPQFAPWISFVGLPWKTLPFALYELQSKWVARVLSKQISLPSQEEMYSDIRAYYSRLDAVGVPKRYTHNVTDYQIGYHDWLAAQCGVPGLEKWRRQMYEETGLNRAIRPETYRDEWEDDHLVLLAHEDFRQYFPSS